MNGRLYDPLVGRFLSPDENVQMPDFTQNFNRYSYCLNNPLSYTDPSGESIIGLIIASAIQQAIVGGARANLAGDNIFGGALKGGVIGGVGVAAGGIGSNISGAIGGFGFGAASGAGLGALDAWAFGGDVGKQAISGGTVGGISGALSGYGNASNQNKMFEEMGINASVNKWTGKMSRTNILEEYYSNNLMAGNSQNNYSTSPINIMDGDSPIKDIFSRVKYLNSSVGMKDMHEIVEPQWATSLAPGERYAIRHGVLYKKHGYRILQHQVNELLLKNDPYFFRINRLKGLRFGNSPFSKKPGFQVLNYTRVPILEIEMTSTLGYNALKKYYHSLTIVHPYDISRFLNR